VLSARDSKLLAYHDPRPDAAIVPASTLKPLVLASAIEAGKLAVTETIDCGQGQRVYPTGTLRDWKPFGTLPVADVLAVSSNVGAARIFERLGLRGLQQGLAEFGLVLPESAIDGIDDASLTAAVTGIGQRGIRVTPVALAEAYAVFAAGGEYRARGQSRRVLTPGTADRVLGLLEHAVNAERATGSGARLTGVRVAGKTGTSDEQAPFASFIGIVPANAPRFVIYVGLGAQSGKLTGSKHAAPAFARIAEYVLALPD
jgi:cell division protein FtsI (penicillin-binding protein 3)